MSQIFRIKTQNFNPNIYNKNLKKFFGLLRSYIS